MKKSILLFLTLTGSLLSSAQQQLPNASFENWAADFVHYDEPNTWFGTSTSCNFTNPSSPTCIGTTIKTTDANAGTYAAKLVNIVNLNSSISKGQLTYSPPSDGYVNFTDKPKTLTGYYKFNNAGSDKISISVTLVGATSTDIIAYGTLDLIASKTGYTLFTVPLQYISQSITPQDIYVDISFNDNASVNSDFTVDNLVFTYGTTTANTNATPTSAGVQFFPNPGKDIIHFEKTVKNISITAANGTAAIVHAANTDILTISALGKGIYIISYEYNETLIHGKLIIE